jgi:DnaJ-class molecular chaperone
MEKYGIPADSVICTDCGGDGQKRLGRKQMILCPTCKGEGRTAKVDPVKEAEEIKQQIEDKNE